MEKESIYMSLDEARVELKRRWADEGLRKRVEDALGNKFLNYFAESPTILTPRQLPSADNGLTFFSLCGNYIGGKIVIQEFLGDKFVSFNEEKKGLGRLRITLENETKAIVDIISFVENEKKKIAECTLLGGDSLVDFHHRLLELDGFLKYTHDDTDWFLSFDSASEYYYYSLLHFVAHGVLCETFFDEGGTNEDSFTHNVVYPAIKKIEEEFNISPMIVRAYPEYQTDDEDFFWWSHSKLVNDYILDYSKRNNLKIKAIHRI